MGFDPEYPFGKLPEDDVTLKKYTRAVGGFNEALGIGPQTIKTAEDFDAYLGLLGQDLLDIMKSHGQREALDISSPAAPNAKVGRYELDIKHGDNEMTKIWTSGKSINACRTKGELIQYAWGLPITVKDIVCDQSMRSVDHTTGETVLHYPLNYQTPESWSGYVSTIQKTLQEIAAADILDKV